jgi:hypothetical protein
MRAGVFMTERFEGALGEDNERSQWPQYMPAGKMYLRTYIHTYQISELECYGATA